MAVDVMPVDCWIYNYFRIITLNVIVKKYVFNLHFDILEIVHLLNIPLCARLVSKKNK